MDTTKTPHNAPICGGYGVPLLDMPLPRGNWAVRLFEYLFEGFVALITTRDGGGK